MSSQVFSSGGSNFRCFHHRARGNKRLNNRDCRTHRKSSIWSSRSDRDVSTSYSEAIDGISNIVDSLENTIGINILVATPGHSKGILSFSLSGVDVLISKAELSKLILSMKLT